jgi:hypothetical protein
MLTSDGGSLTVAARVREFAALRDIDDSEVAARIKSEGLVLAARADMFGKDSAQYLEQEGKITDIKRQALQKRTDDETRMLAEVHAARLDELNSFRSEVGSVFDALTSHSFGQFARSQALGLGRTLTENAAGMAWGHVKDAIPRAGSADSTLGKLLSGTPFGADPLKSAGVTLTKAGVDLSIAARALAMSKTGGGGGVPSGGGGTGGPGLADVASGAADGASSTNPPA